MVDSTTCVDVMLTWEKYLNAVEARVKASPAIAAGLRNAPPWLLPSDQSLSDSYPNIYRELGCATPLRHGHALLVGYQANSNGLASGILYSLKISDKSQHGIQIYQSTMNAWHDALASMPRCLPYFVSPDSWRMHLARPEIFADNLERYLFSDGQPRKSATELDGASFGLGFASAIASQYLSLPLDDDVVGLACCDAYGRLGQIKGLSVKLSAIAQGAPRIRRVLLSKEQEDQEIVQQYADADQFDFIYVSRLEEAFEHMFSHARSDFEILVGRKVEEHVESEEDFLEQMLNFLLCEPARPNTYLPFLKTCEKLVPHAQGTNKDSLEFMRTVAAGREGSDYASAGNIPQVHWFAEHPAWLQRVILSAYCQHSYDTGVPRMDILEPWLQKEWSSHHLGAKLPSISSPHPLVDDCDYYELQLMGAYAKLLEHEGEFIRAQDISYQVADAWAKRRTYTQATWTLQRALILAGALRDKERYEKSQYLAQRVLAYLDGAYVGRLFILLAQARAAIAIKDDAFLNAFQYPRSALERVHPHLRYGFDRFILLRQASSPENAEWTRWSEDARAHLDEDSRPNNEKLRNEYRRIIALQDAIVRGDNTDVARRSKKLADARPLFQFILHAVQKSKDAPIARQRSLIDQVRAALDIYPY